MRINSVIMPKWGLSMEEGKIVCWYVTPGAPVAIGDPLVDVETSKITNTIEATEAGIVRRIFAAPEDVSACGQLIAVISDEGVTDAEIDEFVAQSSRQFQSGQHARSTSNPEPQSLELGNRSLRYLSVGNGGVPAVFIHGFGGDLNNWMFNQPVLAADRQTIAFDLPGHGGSVKEVGEGTVEEMAAIIGNAIDALNLSRVHLVGHSLGGAIALVLAATRPRERTASLALIAPAGLSDRINSDYIEGFVSAKRRRDLQKVLESLFAVPSLATAEMAEELLKFKRLDGADEALRRIAQSSFANGQQRIDFRNALQSLELSTLLLWGTADRIIAVPDDDCLGGILQRLPGVGHMVHLEAVAAVNLALSLHFAAAN
jgi:pyruvate dehydrogenase E2 component (dihydrolipoamide acetyltransferase)